MTGSNGLLMASAAFCALQSGSAFAQATGTAAAAAPAADAGSQVQEIIVTAQKREQRINDVGMAITAASGAQLTARGITSVAGLTELEPSLQFSQSNLGTPVYTIRGVGYFEQSLAATPTVSVYQDEVAYTYPIMTKGALLDVDRVEILKGPQGTLYGQNATGGAVNFIAAKPTSSFAAGIDATYARFNQAQLSGFVSGPLTPTLSARLAVSLEEGGAWQKSDTRNDTLGNKDTQIVRLLLDWKPTDTFKASLNLNGWTDHSDSQAGQLTGIRFLDPQYIGATPLGLSNPLSYLPSQPYSQYPSHIQAVLANPIAPQNARAADWIAGTHPRNDEQYYQGTLRLDYTPSDALSVTSITTYEKYTEADQHDTAGLNVEDDTGVIHGHVETVSQEIRLHGVLDDKKLEWLLGANYESDHTYENDDFNQYFSSASYLTGGSAFSALPIAPFQEFGALNIVTATTKSVFANVEYHVLDSLSVQGGVRYTELDQKIAGCARGGRPAFPDGAAFADFFNFVEFLATGGVAVPATPGSCDTFGPTFLPGLQHTTLDQNNLPWRVGVDWMPYKDNLIYFTVSKGYKAGTSPALGATSYIQLKPVSQEGLLSYELGVKSLLFDRTLQLNGAIFHYDYTDKQELGRIIDPTGIFGALQALVNIPKSVEDGAELSAVWRPLRGLTLNAAATYLDSKVTSSFKNFDEYGFPANFKGEPFPFTPKWSLNYGVRYQWDVAADYSAFVSADATYQSSTTAAFAAQQAATEGPPLNIKAYGLLNLAAGVELKDNHWQIQLWGKNVTNAYYWTTVFYQSDTVNRDAGMPTTYGVTLNYRY